MKVENTYFAMKEEPQKLQKPPPFLFHSLLALFLHFFSLLFLLTISSFPSPLNEHHSHETASC